MFEKYFAEFYVSEIELREYIQSTLEFLARWSPDEFDDEMSELFATDCSAIEILNALAVKIPALEPLVSCVDILDEIELLRCIAIQIDLIMYVKRLEFLVPKVIFMNFMSFWFAFKYTIAVEMIERNLNQPLKYNPDAIYKTLMSLGQQEPGKLRDMMLARQAAEEEINRVVENEVESARFYEVVEELKDSLENYVLKNLPGLLLESFARISIEGMVESANIVDSRLNLNQPLTAQDRKNFVDVIYKMAQRGTSNRLGIKRGGTRTRSAFSWANENKKEFFKAVESLPVIDTQKGPKGIWDFAYSLFQLGGSESVQSDPRLANLPQDLLIQAAKEWYKHSSGFTKMTDNAKPRTFQFRHALHILNYPDKFKLATLQKRFEEGRKLTLQSDNQN